MNTNTDSTSKPLLFNSNSGDDHESVPLTLDDMMESLAGEGMGKVQFVQALLVIFTWFFDAQQLFITVFSDAEPSWHCIDELSCNSNSDICQLSESSWAWDKPVYTSTISEWSLQCSNSILSGLPASSFFMGCLFGGFLLAPLADSMGRKKTLLISCLCMSVPAFLAAFSPNVWVYSASKFLSGLGRAAVGPCILVLPSEILGRKWRNRLGLIGFNFSTLGFLSLSGIAYLTRDSSWRLLYLTTSIPSILYCILLYFQVSESPRWLLMQGREEEAIATLRTFATLEGKCLDLSFTHLFPNQEHEENLLSSIKLLLKTNWARRRLLTAMVVGFGCGAAYYGMPQNVGNLTVNLYLSVALNALMEVPSNSLSIFLIGKWTIKRLLILICIASGVCSITYAMVADHWKVVHVVLELSSFSGANTAFILFLIYALELFPTCVRNSAMSLLRQSAVFGGIFSPLLIALANHNSFLVFGTFGILLSISGIFTLYLPETKNANFYDTMDEQEYMEKTASSEPHC